MFELPSFDPFENSADSFLEFARLRACGGVAFGPAPYPELERAYYLFSHRMASKALKHRFLLQAPPGTYQAIREQLTGQTALQILTQSMLLSDPPRHGNLRKPLAPLLSMNSSVELQRGLRHMAGDLAAKAADSECFDAISDIAVPLSFWLLQRILGVEIKDPWAFKLKTWEVSRALDMRRDPVDGGSNEACQWIWEWAEEILDRDAFTRDGLVSSMSTQIEAGTWTRNDALANIVLLIFAGQETVVDAFGNALKTLNENPDQRELLKSRSVAWIAAAHELLRYEAPVQYAGARIAAEDLTLDDISIKAGDAVVPVLGSANRDEFVFHDGDRLDLTRPLDPSLTFGMGLHVCLGQHVARIELAAMLEALFTHVPRWELDSANAIRRPSIIFRGLQSAPVFVAR